MPRRPPRVWCSDDDWVTLGRELLRRGIVEEISYDAIGIDSVGNKVLNGLFAVPKGSGEDYAQRLVMNLIPCNGLFALLQGDNHTLPDMSRMQTLILDPEAGATWSSEDLKSCFYLFLLPPAWRPWMAFSRPLDIDGRRIWVASRVVPMGWSAATGLVQAAHRQLLRDLTPAGREVRRDRATPCTAALPGSPRRSPSEGTADREPEEDGHGRLAPEPGRAARGPPRPFDVRWQVCIDNLDILELWSLAELRRLRDDRLVPSELQRAIRAEYQRRGVARAPDKSLVREARASALGFEMLGIEGVLSLPTKVLHRLLQLTVWALGRHRIGRKLLQVLLGRWTRLFMLRRVGFCWLQESWRLTSRWPSRPRPWHPVLRRELASCLAILPLLWCNLRLPVDSMLTVSDASLTGGAMCASTRLTEEGQAAAEALADGVEDSILADDLLVISLFDGIGGLRRALDLLRLRPALTLASETNAEARRVVTYAWPDVYELGPVEEITREKISSILAKKGNFTKVLVGGGSPCTDLTSLNIGAAGLEGPESILFYEFLRVGRLVCQLLPDAEVSLFLENVASMKPVYRDIMSKELGVPAWQLCASDLSDVRRKRYYWVAPTPGTPLPCACTVHPGKVVLQPAVVKPPRKGWLSRGASYKGPALPCFVRANPRTTEPRLAVGRHQELPETVARWIAARHCYPLCQFRTHVLICQDKELRVACADEREALLGFSRGHTRTCQPTSYRKAQPARLERKRCDLLGVSFHVPSVALCLGPLFVDWGLLREAPTAQTLVDRAARLSKPRSGRLTAGPAQQLLARRIVEGAIHGGQDARIDALDTLAPTSWPRRPIPVHHWEWKLRWRRTWRPGAHAYITNLEAVAAVSAFLWRFKMSSRTRIRAIHLIDNQATLSILARGRSSSRVLNRQCRKLGVIALLGRLVPVFAYATTDDNPADEGSRHAARNPRRSFNNG